MLCCEVLWNTKLYIQVPFITSQADLDLCYDKHVLIGRISRTCIMMVLLSSLWYNYLLRGKLKSEGWSLPFFIIIFLF